MKKGLEYCTAVGGLRQQLDDGYEQQFSAEREFFLAEAVGQEAEVPVSGLPVGVCFADINALKA